MVLTISEGFGAYLSGIVLANIVLGINTVQAFHYFARFKQDSLGKKISVIVFLPYVPTQVLTARLWRKVVLLPSIQAFQLGCQAWAFWWSLVENDGNSDIIIHPIWALQVFEATCTSTSAIVQSHFVRRIFEMVRNPWMPCLIAFMICVKLGFGITIIIMWYIHPDLNWFMIHRTWILRCFVFSDVAVDSMIASSLCIIMMRRHGYIQTDTRLVTRLISYAMSSGVITSAFSLTVLGITFHHITYPLLMLGSTYAGLYSFVLLTRSATHHLDFNFSILCNSLHFRPTPPAHNIVPRTTISYAPPRVQPLNYFPPGPPTPPLSQISISSTRDSRSAPEGTGKVANHSKGKNVERQSGYRSSPSSRLGWSPSTRWFDSSHAHSSVTSGSDSMELRDVERGTRRFKGKGPATSFKSWSTPSTSAISRSTRFDESMIHASSSRFSRE
ncbi:uncharacterized protein EI90DRAFT_2974824 [Cantharellus anzutake]|uniref:uncharacterized protein n=1 Tax=Cantharellus anzutake TaxID=1750568 RepID=UPI0019063483|nr:uncharacterized protein EI90DRAFT_2974824 [Cantharellus anzutake]KAF8327923.1 hypothetical protein EI90DRAFT_2974824 [Cantharellus anzutake]